MFAETRGNEPRPKKGVPLLCDRIIGFLSDGLPGKPIDPLDVAWHQSTRRTLRKQTRGGREIGILLPIGQRLTHRAILYDGDDLRVVVNVLPTAVLVAHPSSIGDMGRLALELGNLHAPAQIVGQTLITLADGPAEEVLDRLGIPFKASIERFEPMPVAAAISYADGFRIIEPNR